MPTETAGQVLENNPEVVSLNQPKFPDIIHYRFDGFLPESILC